MSDNDSKSTRYVVCRCQNCDGHIEFDASSFTAGETHNVECPHCHLETVIFVPPPDKTEPTSPKPQSTPQPSEQTKQCPFCAETIKAEAVVCRFCGRDLVNRQPERIRPVTTIAPEKPETVVQARSGVVDGVKLGCGMFILLPLILIGIGIVVLILLAMFGSLLPN